MSADRNLLFGTLALQLDFINRDGLIAGMQTWVNDKEKSLAEILQTAGALSAANRQLLEPLVARHVEQHDNDPQKSLAAVSSLGWSTVERLATLVDPDINATLPLVGSARRAEPESKVAAGQSTSPGGRFRVLRFHAAGGLGQVSVARDSELNREVALKEIKSEYAVHALARDRFLLEAEITGGLEHPSIVPVYGLGTYDDGRPFYAMRFIKGDTLKEAIDRYHDPERSKQQTDSQCVLELRQLLGRFIDVCQAVEYAHSRGVLHRDLKPGNVMLGKYGETLVVDWGLAKARGSQLDSARHDPAEMPLAPTSGSTVEQTEVGQRIGTLQYMSPEQSLGQLDQLGPATDIFALGATLYHLLTGKTVYHAATKETLFTCLASASFPKPRSVLKSIPKPLEAICLKALAEKPADRYASAQALLDDIEKHLADEPVAAYQEPWTVRVRRWARKRPALVSGSIATVAVTLLALVIGTFMLGQKNRELAEKEAIATAVKDFLLFDLLQLADPRKQASARTAEVKVDPNLRVQDLFAHAEGKIEARFGDQPAVAAELRKLVTKSVPTELTIRELLMRASQKIAGQFVGQPLVEHEVLITIGNALRSIGEPHLAIAHLERCRSLSLSHFGAEHRQTLGSISELAQAYGAAGRLAEALQLYEQNLQLQQAKLGRDHHETLASMNNLAATYSAAGRWGQAIRLLEETWQLRQAKFGKDHPDTLGAMNNLAAAYQQSGRLAQALPLYEAAMKLQQAKVGPEHPDTLRMTGNLAAAYSAAGRLDEAIALEQESLRIQLDLLGPKHPDTLISMNNLAADYRDAGRLTESLQLYKETLQIMQAKFGPDHPEILRPVCGLAMTLKELRNWEEAEEQYLAAYQGTAQLPPALQAQFRYVIAYDLVPLYTAWEKPAEAAKWQQELAKWQQQMEELSGAVRE